VQRARVVLAHGRRVAHIAGDHQRV
jgi:hypothetical protein